MKNLLPALLITCFSFGVLQAQTTEEMAAMKEAKSAELTALEAQLKDVTAQVETLKSEIAVLTEQLTPYPRWDVGAHGNFGFNFSNFDQWLSKEQPSTNAVALTFTGNGFANLDQRKYFWRNKLNLTLGWQKFDDKENPDDNGFDVTADAMTVSTLYGYKLSDKWALSTLAEYRSSVIDNFNNPGYLDLGAGATWTPITDLVVVIHPLNYNLIFSQGGFDYKSTFGTKLLADYKRQLTKGIAWSSSLSAFLSYEGSDYNNWTWINGLTTKVKGIGVGLDIGLRSNRQEAAEAGLSNNPLQTYYVFGLTYGL